MVKLAEIGRAALADVDRGGAPRRWLRHNPVVRIRQIVQEARQTNRNLAQAQRNAIHHYGIAPEFFEYLLGDTVGYSEGYWTDGTETLNQAKYNGYDYIASGAGTPTGSGARRPSSRRTRSCGGCSGGSG